MLISPSISATMALPARNGSIGSGAALSLISGFLFNDKDIRPISFNAADGFICAIVNLLINPAFSSVNGQLILIKSLCESKLAKSTCDASKATSFLLNEAPDVLALQELEGFDTNSLVSFAASYGHNYSYIFDRDTQQSTGITSKYPSPSASTAPSET